LFWVVGALLDVILAEELVDPMLAMAEDVAD
jgi:hypothetical protein